MNKNEKNNKKLDSKELGTVSGGKLSKEEQRKKLEEFLKTKQGQSVLCATAYGGPSLFNHTLITPKIKIKKEPETAENTDSSKASDALLPEKLENTKE